MKTDLHKFIPSYGGVIMCRRLHLVFVSLVVLVVGCQSNNDSIDTENGPTMHYSFNETAGTQVNNEEFDGLHGTIFGASRVPGKIGNALDFSSMASAHVLFDICCHADPNGQGGITLSFPNDEVTLASWVKPTAMADNTIYHIFGDGYSGVQSMKLQVNDQAIVFILFPPNAGSPVTILTSSGVLTNDTWTHIAVTYDGSHAVFYLNGVEDTTADLIFPVEDIVNDYFIGGVPTTESGPTSFPGVIDEVVVSNIAFTQDEIEALFSAGNP